MFGEYAQIASYIQPSKNLAYRTEDLDQGHLPEFLCPAYRAPLPWGFSKAKSGLHEDFIMIAEFSELEGPKPLMTIPKDGGSHFDQNTFAVKILAVDHQNPTDSNFSISEDAQVVVSDSEAGVYAFVHHIVLYDNTARGFVRPYCIAYVTPDERKLMHFYAELSWKFKKVAKLLKYGNKMVFVSDLERHLKDLEYTKSVLLNQVCKMRLRSPEVLEDQNLEIRRNAENELYRGLETIRQSSQEIRDILSVLKPLLPDLKMEARFRKMENKAYQNCCHGGLDKMSLPESGCTDGAAIDELDMRCGSLSEPRLSPLVLFKHKDYKPVLVETKKARRFNAPLRGLHELCSWGAKEGLKVLRLIHTYFKREPMVLELERNELRLFRPHTAGLYHGQCITGNFLTGIQMKQLVDVNADSEQTWSLYSPQWGSLRSDSDDSFKSAGSYTGTGLTEASPSSFHTYNSQGGPTFVSASASPEISLLMSNEYYPDLNNPLEEEEDDTSQKSRASLNVTLTDLKPPLNVTLTELKPPLIVSLSDSETLFESVLIEESGHQSSHSVFHPPSDGVFKPIQTPTADTGHNYLDKIHLTDVGPLQSSSFKSQNLSGCSQHMSPYTIDSLLHESSNSMTTQKNSNLSSSMLGNSCSKPETTSSVVDLVECVSKEENLILADDKLSQPEKIITIESTLKNNAGSNECDNCGEQLGIVNSFNIENVFNDCRIRSCYDKSSVESNTISNLEKKNQSLSFDSKSSFPSVVHNENKCYQLDEEEAASLQREERSDLESSKLISDKVIGNHLGAHKINRTQHRDSMLSSMLEQEQKSNSKNIVTVVPGWSQKSTQENQNLTDLTVKDKDCPESTPGLVTEHGRSNIFINPKQINSIFTEGSQFVHNIARLYQSRPEKSSDPSEDELLKERTESDASSAFTEISVADLFPHLMGHGIEFKGNGLGEMVDTHFDNGDHPTSQNSVCWKPRCGLYTVGDCINNLTENRPGWCLLEVMSSYHFLEHIIFSLLSGRVVLVAGSAKLESEVIRVVNALSVFVLMTRRKTNSVLEWTSKPLKITDLVRLKLVGVCRPEKRSLDSFIPSAVKKVCSILDLEKRVIIAPAYQGHFITSLLSKRKIMGSDVQFLAYIKWWLMEVQSKAYIFFHNFSLDSAGSIMYSHSPKDQRAAYVDTVSRVMARIGVRDSDCDIIEYFTEMVKLAKVEAHIWPGAESANAVSPLTLQPKICEKFRC